MIELVRAWQFAENETISMRVHALQGESMARHKILYTFMLEASQDGDFPQSSLAVRLVLEGADLFDGNFLAIGADTHVNLTKRTGTELLGGSEPSIDERSHLWRSSVFCHSASVTPVAASTSPFTQALKFGIWIPLFSLGPMCCVPSLSC